MMHCRDVAPPAGRREGGVHPALLGGQVGLGPVLSLGFSDGICVLRSGPAVRLGQVTRRGPVLRLWISIEVWVSNEAWPSGMDSPTLVYSVRVEQGARVPVMHLGSRMVNVLQPAFWCMPRQFKRALWKGLRFFKVWHTACDKASHHSTSNATARGMQLLCPRTS